MLTNVEPCFNVQYSIFNNRRSQPPLASARHYLERASHPNHEEWTLDVLGRGGADVAAFHD